MAEKKTAPKVAAVIDIGSNFVKMRVSQLKKGVVEDLEFLETPLWLGHEVFHSGKISFETVRELSAILRGYAQVMSEYGVAQYKMVATSALREAENRAYIADLLGVQNRLSLEVLEDDQEKTLIYSRVFSLLAENEWELNNALVSFVGTGSIGLAVYRKGQIVHSQNLPIGTLKLRDMFGQARCESPEFYVMLEEYLEHFFTKLRASCPAYPLEQLVVVGNELEQAARICDVSLQSGIFRFDAGNLATLYRQLRTMSLQKISFKYDLSEEEAANLYAALAIYAKLIGQTSARVVLSPKAELWDALMKNMLVPKSQAAYEEAIARDSLACAKEIARHYQCNREHQEFVLNAAGKIFDKMRKKHGLDEKKRLLLEIAVALHECGHYINSKRHLASTFDLIKNMHIYGLSKGETALVAVTAKYNESHEPDYRDAEFAALSENDRLVVSKLTAIFRLANALDISQKQKLSNIQIRLEEESLIVTAEHQQNILLEQWAFDACAAFFEEVFGVKPALHNRLKLV